MLDCIIVGSGPAGFSAALNLKIRNKAFLWFGRKGFSEKLLKAEQILNYPGFCSLSGEALQEHYEMHRKSADIEIVEKTVTNVAFTGTHYMVLADNELYEAKTIILAMGVMNVKPLAGEQEFLGRGVSYCATCDGRFYQGKTIAVLCYSEKYEHEVTYLSDLAERVYYFPIYKDCTLSHPSLERRRDFPIEIFGTMKAQGLRLRGGQELLVDGVFFLRNAIAPTSLIPGIEMEEEHIAVNRRQETSLPGCFAAGDCTGRPYQYAKAIGEGNVAAHSCIEYLDN